MLVCVCVYVCSPLKLLHRHNEVWYVVNGEPVCDGMMYKPIQNTTATTANTANTATATTAASPATTDPTATE